MSAATSALLDQIGAATRDAYSVISRTAVKQQEAPSWRPPGPYATALLDALFSRAHGGTQRYCRHLRSPAPAWLIGWRPERLLCHRCANKVFREVNGTPEDRTCDVCRQERPPLQTVLAAAGPVLVTFGACPPCFEAEGVAA